MPEHLTGATTSTQRNRWSSATPKPVSRHLRQKSKELDDNNPNKNDRKDPKTIAALVNEGRFSYPYMPVGIYAEIRSLSNLRFQTQEELTRIKNRLARCFSIYFPEYKDVYGDIKAVGGRLVLKAAPLPEDIIKLGTEAPEVCAVRGRDIAGGKERRVSGDTRVLPDAEGEPTQKDAAGGGGSL